MLIRLILNKEGNYSVEFTLELEEFKNSDPKAEGFSRAKQRYERGKIIYTYSAWSEGSLSEVIAALKRFENAKYQQLIPSSLSLNSYDINTLTYQELEEELKKIKFPEPISIFDYHIDFNQIKPEEKKYCLALCRLMNSDNQENFAQNIYEVKVNNEIKRIKITAKPQYYVINLDTPTKKDLFLIEKLMASNEFDAKTNATNARSSYMIYENELLKVNLQNNLTYKKVDFSQVENNKDFINELINHLDSSYPPSEFPVLEKGKQILKIDENYFFVDLSNRIEARPRRRYPGKAYNIIEDDARNGTYGLVDTTNRYIVLEQTPNSHQKEAVFKLGKRNGDIRKEQNFKDTQDKGSNLSFDEWKKLLIEREHFLTEKFNSNTKPLVIDEENKVARIYTEKHNDNDLHSFLQSNPDLIQNNTLKNFNTKLEIAHAICFQIGTLHRKKIIHCDIKPKNIMWQSAKENKVIQSQNQDKVSGAEEIIVTMPVPKIDNKAIIIDFGLSKLSKTNWLITGTPPYCAPEEYKAEPADIFSVGMILKKDLFPELFDGTKLSKTGLALKKIIKSMVDEVPEDRPNCHRVLKRLRKLDPELYQQSCFVALQQNINAASNLEELHDLFIECKENPDVYRFINQSSFGKKEEFMTQHNLIFSCFEEKVFKLLQEKIKEENKIQEDEKQNKKIDYEQFVKNRKSLTAIVTNKEDKWIKQILKERSYSNKIHPAFFGRPKYSPAETLYTKLKMSYQHKEADRDKDGKAFYDKNKNIILKEEERSPIVTITR